MTNEILVELIKKGNPDLIATLWEQVKYFCKQFAYRYYSNNTNACNAAGIVYDDLLQESYFAFLDAVKAYTPDKDFSFITSLKYPLINCYRTLLGIRTSKRNPLNCADSLDIPICEDENILLADTIEDANAQLDFEKIELTDIQRIVREEVALLRDEKQRYTISAYYLHGKTYKTIAEKYDVIPERIRQIIKAGLKKLSYRKRLRELYCEFESHVSEKILDDIIYTPECFEIINRIKDRQKRRLSK